MCTHRPVRLMLHDLRRFKIILIAATHVPTSSGTESTVPVQPPHSTTATATTTPMNRMEYEGTTTTTTTSSTIGTSGSFEGDNIPIHKKHRTTTTSSSSSVRRKHTTDSRGIPGRDGNFHGSRDPDQNDQNDSQTQLSTSPNGYNIQLLEAHTRSPTAHSTYHSP